LGQFHITEQWETIENAHLSKVYRYICTIGEPRGDMEAFKNDYFHRSRVAWFRASDTLRAPHIGQTLVESAQAIGVPRDKLDLRACMEAYDLHAFPATSAFPDVLEMLPRWRDLGIRFGIVTNAYHPMWMRDIELDEHGLLEFFPECRISAADVGYLKPHPAIIERRCAGV
jgi:FMN phosphatase YigB (HAD superfamily)